jgi:hypothetical protein
MILGQTILKSLLKIVLKIVKSISAPKSSFSLHGLCKASVSFLGILAG